MVLTNAQRTSFFQGAAQLGIPAATFAQMANDGIETERDLLDFDETSIKQIAENLRRPPGGVDAFVFGAKSQTRLVHACNLMRYYHTTGRDPTPANLQWDSVMKNFSIAWQALKDRKENDDEPETPKISRGLPILKWTEAFPDFLRQVIGVRMIPLFYVIRTSSTVPVVPPGLAAGQPYSTEHGSVEEELIIRASHNHVLFNDDNGKVYHYLEEATRSTSYAASIKPFQRLRNGRAAWFALLNQYAGTDKWEAEIKKSEQILHTRKWKGQSNFTLESFCGQHRNAFVSLTACSQHVEYQLPNEHSRVGFLLNGIECSDAGLQAAMASIRTDTGDTGKRNNFEDAVAHLVPYDPVAKKRSEQGSKRNSALISDVSLEEAQPETAHVDATNVKPSIGKTGVHFRWYKAKEYFNLNDAQRKELNEWRASLPDNDPLKLKKGKTNKKQKFTSKQQISSMVAKQIKKMLKAETKEEEKKEEELASISAVVQAEIAKLSSDPSPTVNVPKSPTIRLSSILKNAKNSPSASN